MSYEHWQNTMEFVLMSTHVASSTVYRWILYRSFEIHMCLTCETMFILFIFHRTWSCTNEERKTHVSTIRDIEKSTNSNTHRISCLHKHEHLSLLSERSLSLTKLLVTHSKDELFVVYVQIQNPCQRILSTIEQLTGSGINDWHVPRIMPSVVMNVNICSTFKISSS
jgi:hypothetical protein